MHRQVAISPWTDAAWLDEDCSCGTWCSPTIWLAREAVTISGPAFGEHIPQHHGQYRPCYRALEHPPLARRPHAEEMERAFRLARAAV